MQPIAVNLVGLVGAAAARVALGAVWYSPALFVRSWLKLSGVSEAKMNRGMGRAIAVDVVGSLLTAFVLLHAIRYAAASTPLDGAVVGFMNWLGFVAVVLVGTMTYEKKPFKLFAINAGYQLVSLAAMGAILQKWG